MLALAPDRKHKTMKRSIFSLLVVAVFLTGLAAVWAETYELDLKRLQPVSRGQMSSSGSRGDYMYRSTYPQYFFMQIGGPSRVPPGAEDFPKVVRKQPAKYFAKHPFRGVARLGTQQYGFVFDAKDAQSDQYARLFFDFNHNGDLTDDKVIEAASAQAGFLSGPGFAEFPRIDVMLDVEGEEIDYAFSVTVYSYSSGQMRYATAQFNSAAYREGEIELNGKKRRVVLLDFNSNGRFDDVFRLHREADASEEAVVPEFGDMLLIDPDPKLGMSYDPTSCDHLYYVSNLIGIDDKYYDLKVSVSGQDLTLAPADDPVGYVTNVNDGFRVLLSGDKGLVKISGGKDKPVPVPAGTWRLHSYTLDRTGYDESASAASKKTEQDKEGEDEAKPKTSLWQALAQAVLGDGGAAEGAMLPTAGPTMVSAQGTSKFKEFQVQAGKTVPLSFGPPYRPVVSAMPSNKPGYAYLSMSIVGSAGEECTNLVVKGRRPTSPRFRVTTPDGNEVASGKFEYG
jgi:hypothetical protein